MAESSPIRFMTLNDLDAVMEIAKKLPDAPKWPRSSYEAALSYGSYPQRIGLVADSEWGGVAGFLIAAVVPPQAEVESIAVPSEYQRTGIARQLVSYLADELRRRHCSELLLEVRVSNHPARRLYSSLGFTETARRPAYYDDPKEDAILMSRSLR